MSEEVKARKLGQDDEGNWDDKRVASWILLFASIGTFVYGLFFSVSNGIDPDTVLDYGRVMLWPAIVGLIGSVVEKFSARKGG